MPVSINAHIAAMEEHQTGTIKTLKTVRRRNNNRLEMIALAEDQENPAIALTQDQIDGLVETQLADTIALRDSLEAAITAMTE